ncbi:MAG: branched-chain amino acid ABC transporter permease [Desulfobacterales bacterium]|nr:branched-chain amino acid ABC transporter permease [Desulfobacterales bacterium]
MGGTKIERPSSLNKNSDLFEVAPAKRTRVLLETGLVMAAFLILVPVLAIYRVTEFMIFCIFVLSFDLLYGYMGRLSFGQMLYLGTGVYVSTLFSLHVNPNPVLTMLAGVLGGAIVAGLLGLIIVRLADASFALTNLAFNQVGFFLIGSAFQEVTHGEDGISSGVEPWGFLDFANEPVAFVFVLVCLLVTFYILKVLTNSPYGIIIRSIKEDESRVRFLGYSTFYYKWLTFVIAGGVAALAGTLYTLYIQFVSPVSIHPLSNVEVIFACLIGGAGNLYGALAGGVFFMTLKDNLATHIPEWEWILGILLLVIVFWLRRGLTGFATFLIGFLRQKIARGQPAEA